MVQKSVFELQCVYFAETFNRIFVDGEYSEADIPKCAVVFLQELAAFQERQQI